MKIVIALLVLCCITSLTGKAQSASGTEQQQVQQTIIHFFDGFSAFDANKIMSFSTKDVKILENGVVWNEDSLRAKINPEKAKLIKRVNQLEFIQTEVEGKTAWTAYHNRAHITLNGKSRTIQWLESAVLVKESNTWKVKLLHSTVIEPEKEK